MNVVSFIWDLEDDPDGNVQHVAEHDLTMEEVESVFSDPDADIETSRSSGNPIIRGSTFTGRYVLIVWERVDDDPLTVRVITAYEPTEDDV